jgi:5-methylcytosine-specific restriction protein A
LVLTMAIPSSITRDHVLRAMEILADRGIEAGSQSTRFDVVAPDGTRLPPKLVISLAAELATGNPLSRSDFSGGDQSNDRLENLGFEIRLKPGIADPTIREADLVPGKRVTNDELTHLFKVGNSGGMRWSGAKQCLVLIADHTKSLYDDRWDGDTLHYTGMGRLGDQTFSGQNKRLAEQTTSGIVVHLFEVFTDGEYVYDGTVRLSGTPWTEVQVDDDRKPRKVIVFPLKLTSISEPPKPTRGEIENIAKRRQKGLLTCSAEELKKLATIGGRPRPGKRDTTALQFERNAAVVAYVKKVAAGRCDLCGEAAPFSTVDGPYLECHHVFPLAKGGPDTIDNAVALCPNCHRKMHLKNERADRAKILERIRLRDRDQPSAA